MGLLERLRESVYTHGTHLLLSLVVFWGEVSDISLVYSPSSNWVPHGESKGGRALPAFCWIKHHLEDKWGSLPGYTLCIRTDHLRSSGDGDVADLPVPARSLEFDLCPFFPKLHLLTSFLSGYLSGDYLLALALQFWMKRNTHNPNRMVVHRSYFCISSSCPSLFQWWLLVLT